MVCTSRFRPFLIYGLCTMFASNSRIVRLFQAALDTCLNSPFFASLSVHGLDFTVYAPSQNVCVRGLFVALSCFFVGGLLAVQTVFSASHFFGDFSLFWSEV